MIDIISEARAKAVVKLKEMRLCLKTLSEEI